MMKETKCKFSSHTYHIRSMFTLKAHEFEHGRCDIGCT